jgi:hypothetical protein
VVALPYFQADSSSSPPPTATAAEKKETANLDARTQVCKNKHSPTPTKSGGGYKNLQTEQISFDCPNMRPFSAMKGDLGGEDR